jgi:hypothetical protein
MTWIIDGVPQGSGGGGATDANNKGWFADITALQTAYPVGQDGWFAILGSTDTVWVWDTTTTAWKDTDTTGQVQSVNTKTGAVVLNADDIANGVNNKWLRESTNLTEKTSRIVNNLGSYEIRPAIGDVDSGVKYSHLNDSLKTTIDNKPSSLNNKVYYVSAAGNDSNIGYDINKPFLTLSAALTAAGNSGDQICILPGTYAGNYTINQLNVTITGFNDETSGIVNFTGTITVNNASSSVRIQGLAIANLVHANAGNLYVNNITVNTTTTLSGSGFFKANNSDFQVRSGNLAWTPSGK